MQMGRSSGPDGFLKEGVRLYLDSSFALLRVFEVRRLMTLNCVRLPGKTKQSL